MYYIYVTNIHATKCYTIPAVHVNYAMTVGNTNSNCNMNITLQSHRVRGKKSNSKNAVLLCYLPCWCKKEANSVVLYAAFPVSAIKPIFCRDIYAIYIPSSVGGIISMHM